eukprot:8887432-Alexandrium_andersonii.AAC.1
MLGGRATWQWASCGFKRGSDPGTFELAKWPGVDNPTDVLTKAVNGEAIGKPVSSLGVTWEDGGAETAPLLD